MCERCKCERCGAPAVGALPDGRLLCEDCYSALLPSRPCRRCGAAGPAGVAHGLTLCAVCYAWYKAVLRTPELAYPETLTEQHPELADVALVYANADAAGMWDPWL